MAKLYSFDLRTRVAAFAIAHKSAQLAATTFSVSKATAVRWTKQLRDAGGVAIGRVGGHKKPILLDQGKWIAERIESEPHVTLRILQSELEAKALWSVMARYGTSCMPRI
jgi:transposase